MTLLLDQRWQYHASRKTVFQTIGLGLQKEESFQKLACMEASRGCSGILVGILGGAVTAAAVCCELGLPMVGIIAAAEVPCQTTR